MTDQTSTWFGWWAIRRQWPLCLATYVLTVLVSLPAAAALGVVMDGYFGHRLVAAEVTATWSLPALAELAVEESTALVAVAVAATIALLSWLIVQTFICGAMLASGRADGATSLRTAFMHGGQHFWGLLGLGVLGLPFVLVVGGLGFFAAGRLTEALTDGTTSSATVMAVRIPLTFAAWVLLIWASSTHDLMRVKKVDGAGVFRSFVVGLWRGLRRPFALLGHALPWVLGAWGLTAIISLVDARLAWTTPAAIVFGVGLQQILVLCRTFLRLGGLAAVQGLVPPERSE